MADPADIPSGFFVSTDTNNRIAAAPAIGFSASSYGTVTQATNKTTTVVVNAKAGVVTMNAASLASGTGINFTMTNSAISATDVVFANCGVGGTAGAYQLNILSVGAGTAIVRVNNITGGALAEALTINFVVIDTYAA